MKRASHDMKPLPPIEYLRECLEYRDGKLVWLERPEHHPFKDARMRNVWNGTYAGKQAGSEMANGYRLISLDNAKFLEHRIIYHMMRGPLDPSKFIDHIDYDHTNNRIENLRPCSHAENLMNQPGRLSKYGVLPKHVRWSKNERKFKVCMRANGSVHHIGTFETIDAAEAAAAKARQRLHGEFQNCEAGK